MRAYVINLDRSPDRLAHMREQFDHVAGCFERFAAVDGDLMSQSALADFAAASGGQGTSDWSPGEVGVFLSHFRIWRLIAEGTERAAAVFEDDVYLASDMAALLEDDGWIPDDADIVRLEANRKLLLRDGRNIGVSDGRRLFRMESGTWGAAGYIVTRRAAERLVRSDPATFCAVDLFLFKASRSAVAAGLRVYQVVPAPCVQAQLLPGQRDRFKSLIGEEGRMPPLPEGGPSFLGRMLPWKKQPVPFRA